MARFDPDWADLANTEGKIQPLWLVQALETIVQEKWNDIAAPVCEKYVNSMFRGLQAVINAKGAHTK
jgi:hypothetical protein